jgi:hypothetical protein
MKHRRLEIESLETRFALDATLASEAMVSCPVDVDSPETQLTAADVNQDGMISPLDALIVINDLNRSGASPLEGHSASSTILDVNRDGQVTASDALEVINAINQKIQQGTVVIYSDPYYGTVELPLGQELLVRRPDYDDLFDTFVLTSPTTGYALAAESPERHWFTSIEGIRDPNGPLHSGPMTAIGWIGPTGKSGFGGLEAVAFKEDGTQWSVRLHLYGVPIDCVT